jgi:hypothetical protein
MHTISRANELPEFVFQPLIAKIALFFGNPFLQAKVWFDDELGHPCPEECRDALGRAARFGDVQTFDTAASVRDRPVLA